jgi:hypothetical protein
MQRSIIEISNPMKKMQAAKRDALRRFSSGAISRTDTAMHGNFRGTFGHALRCYRLGLVHIESFDHFLVEASEKNAVTVREE